jgi:DHA1 family tetracycline resistance protein-like MFS transporter
MASDRHRAGRGDAARGGLAGGTRLAIWGIALAAVTFVGFGFANAAWMVLVLLPFAALTDLVPPTLTAMSANAVDEDRQGMVQGVIASLSSLAAVLAPLVFTPMFGSSFRAILGVYLPGGRSCSPRF